jgi:hypothetical protein
MAFVCTITEESYHGDIFRNGDCFSEVVNIGHDPAEGKGYSVVVGIDRTGGGGYELYFFVVETTDGNEYPYWSGRETVFLKGEDRAKVMAIVTLATRAIIDVARQNVFWW